MLTQGKVDYVTEAPLVVVVVVGPVRVEKNPCMSKEKKVIKYIWKKGKTCGNNSSWEALRVNSNLLIKNI